MSFKIKNYSTIFLHIPKCGGSSIFKTLKNNGFVDYKFNKTHIKISELEKKFIENFKFITQIRNPYSRFYSHYHYAVEWIDKRIKGELPTKGKTIEFYERLLKFLLSVEFDGFVELLYKKRLRESFLKDFDKSESDIFLRICDFLNIETNIKIFKIEDNNFWNYLESEFKIVPSVKLFEKKSNYKSKKYDSFTSKAVYEYFKKDFDLFLYEKDSWININKNIA